MYQHSLHCSINLFCRLLSLSPVPFSESSFSWTCSFGVRNPQVPCLSQHFYPLWHSGSVSPYLWCSSEVTSLTRSQYVQPAIALIVLTVFFFCRSPMTLYALTKSHAKSPSKCGTWAQFYQSWWEVFYLLEQYSSSCSSFLQQYGK